MESQIIEEAKQKEQTSNLVVTEEFSLTEELNNDYLRVSAFPNPTADKIQFKFSNNVETIVHLVLYDQKGMVIKNNNYLLEDGSIEINLNALSKGVYLYKLTIDHQVYKGKFIKK